MSFKRGKLAIVRVDLPTDSPVINKTLQELQLPPDSVLVSIIRGDEVIVPKGNTMLLAQDDLIALTLVQNEQQLLNYLIGKL
jgi:trk system potassium uptake protein TrkA